MTSIIPIKNIYYMVLYAFDKVKSTKLKQDKSFESDLTLSDVMIEIFIDEVTKLIKSGIFRDYNHTNEDSVYIKGKINIAESVKRVSAKKNIIYDYFSENNDLNIIIKYTLNRLLMSNISIKHKKRIKNIYPVFQDTLYQNINDQMYKQILFNKVTKKYEFAIRLSVFINKKIIPSDQSGNSTFIDIQEDNETMSMIYENFLRNFYKIHTNYQVSGRSYDWFLEPINDSSLCYLPKMITDIEIIIDEQTKIIIDAKYYKNALTSRYNLKKFSSNNMYQMNTYLEHNLKYTRLRGILLYPCVGYYFDEKYRRPEKYDIELKTIDLNLDWIKIEEQLLNIF